jgi:hypothetical protein
MSVFFIFNTKYKLHLCFMPDYDELMRNPNRITYEDAALYIQEYPEDIEILFGYFTTGSIKDRNRSAWLMHHVSDLNPAVFKPWQGRLIDYAPKAKTDAEKRFIMRLFAKHGLPDGEALQGRLLQLAFNWVTDPKESIAVNAYCLTTLHRFCKIHPELESELRAIIADQLPRSSAAFKSRARHILQDLNPMKPK